MGVRSVGKNVLVTGVARPLGSRLARALARADEVDRVIGVDVRPPGEGLGDAEFVRADIRQPTIGTVLATTRADTVIHLALSPTLPDTSSRGPVKESNVIGTMQLLAACSKAPSVRRLVVRSTTSVYGAAAKDPALFTEELAARTFPPDGFARDAVEVEGYVRGFARRRPDVSVGVFRLADVLGPVVDSPLAGYFSLPMLPTVFGFDPRLQFLHTTDAVRALRTGALEPRRGTRNDGVFNIAADGVMLLSQAARRAGRPSVPLPRATLSVTGEAIRRFGLGGLLGGTGRVGRELSPELVRLLTHGRVVDTSRMRELLRFAPEYTTAETFADYVRARTGGATWPSRSRDPDRTEQTERTTGRTGRGERQ